MRYNFKFNLITKFISRILSTMFPTMIFCISLIYPAIWGIYFSILKYIRIETTIDVYELFSPLFVISIDWYILCIFLIPHLFLWIAFFLWFMRSVRLTLWACTETMLYSFHIRALQYYDYYRICELIYKGHFVYFDVISGSTGATTYDIKQCSIIRRIIAYMFYRPYILHLIFLWSLLIELLLSHGKLHYGVYTLFFYPFVLGISHCFHQFGFSDFYRDVCLSDYIVWNFANPRCYTNFWFYVRHAQYWYGFEHIYPPDLLDVIRRTCALEEIAYAHSRKLSRALLFRVWGRKNTLDIVALKAGLKDYSKTIITGIPRRWSIRLAGCYYHKKGTRWFHSSSVLYNPLPNKIHPLTIHFIKKDPYAVLVLLNHPATDFTLVQRMTKQLNWPSPAHLYTNYATIEVEPRSKTLMEVLEANFVMRFQCLIKEGVIIGTYKPMKQRFGYSNLETMQMRPDLVSLWLNSVYKYKGYLGIDQKNHKVTNLGRNQVITNSQDNYNKIIDKFKEGLDAKFGEDPNLQGVLQQLQSTCNDPEAHIRIWAESLHLFPEKWRPPLLLDKSFDESNLKPEIIELLRKGEAYIKRVSDELYTLNVSEETGSLDDKALYHFEGSFLQDLMK